MRVLCLALCVYCTIVRGLRSIIVWLMRYMCVCVLMDVWERHHRIHQKAMESSAGQDVDEKSGLGLGARACAMGAAVYGGYETLV